MSIPRAGTEFGSGPKTRVFRAEKILPMTVKIFFTGFKISAHARPVRSVGGPGAGPARAGLGLAYDAQVYPQRGARGYKYPTHQKLVDSLLNKTG
jgi:hypothetical protein